MKKNTISFNKVLLLVILMFIALGACMKRENISRPKLVVGLVIDQMRWDYLYRYYDLYGNDGFKRLLKEGFNCQNTMVNYIPTNTAPGHSCIYTGSVPSIHGIAGNNWIDEKGKVWYCVDDEKYHMVLGSKAKSSSMAPTTLLTTTITDELRLATNQKSRVFGIAIKDRGSILPAGHLGNAAYFYNDSLGVFTTTTYYPQIYQNPEWLQNFNKRKVPDSLAKQNWSLLYPDNMYYQSTIASAYGKGFKGEKAPAFPHRIDTLGEYDRLTSVKSMPGGNTMTLMMAEACMEGEKIGMGSFTDFLAVSMSSTDHAGHQFGPNSLELEDMYLRLDQEIANFLNYLDQRVGRGNYLFFLTADHGAAHNAIFLKDMDVPADVANYQSKTFELNYYLHEQMKDPAHPDSIYNFVLGMPNYQVCINNDLIADLKMDRQQVKENIMDWLKKQPGISYIIDLEHIDRTSLPEPIRTLVINGYNSHRSGCIEFIMDPAWYDYGNTTTTTFTGTTHSSWNPYDTHIPLLWYGWNIPRGETHRETAMTDISATLAALLHIQMPNGCIGKPITEIVK